MHWLKNICRAAFPKSLWVYHFQAGDLKIGPGDSNSWPEECDLCAVAATRALAESEKAGIRPTASPRHADVILVTGPLDEQDRAALERLWEAVPEPKRVVAAGACGCAKGEKVDAARIVPLDRMLPTDLVVQGCPPDPTAIFSDIRQAALISPAEPATFGASLDAEKSVGGPRPARKPGKGAP